MAITIKQVNAAIVAAGLKDIQLVKGSSYFYFTGEREFSPQGGVYVNAINQLSVAEWVAEAQARYLEA